MRKSSKNDLNNETGKRIAFIARLIHEKKGRSVVVLDLRGVNSYLEYFVIVSGNSAVHCRALARELQRNTAGIGIKERNRPDLSSSWIILDYDEIIVHIFTDEMREFYQLEKLWGDAVKVEYKLEESEDV